MVRHPSARLILMYGLVGVVIVSAGYSWGQTKPKPKPKDPSNVRTLDVKAEKLQDQILRDVKKLADEYESAGQFDRAKKLLEVLEKMDPNLPGLKQKLKELNETMLNADEFTVDFDVSKTWTVGPIAAVQKDRLARIEISGDYTFGVNQKTGPGGLDVDDKGDDNMVRGIPAGAIIGYLVVDGKPQKPFAVGTKYEWTPKENAKLTLKVNAPSQHTCKGKLVVTLGGMSKP